MNPCIVNGINQGWITPDQGRQLQQRVNDLLREGLAPPTIKAQMSKELEIAQTMRSWTAVRSGIGTLTLWKQ